MDKKYNVGSVLKDIGGSSYDKWSEDDMVDKTEVELLVFYGKGDNCLDVLVDLEIMENVGQLKLEDETWIHYLILKIDGKPKIKAEIFDGPREWKSIINPINTETLHKRMKSKAKLPPINDETLLKLMNDSTVN